MSDAALNLRLVDRVTVMEAIVEAQRQLSRCVTLLARPSSEAHQEELVMVHFCVVHLGDRIAALEAAMKKAHELRLIRNSKESVQ